MTFNLRYFAGALSAIRTFTVARLSRRSKLLAAAKPDKSRKINLRNNCARTTRRSLQSRAHLANRVY